MLSSDEKRLPAVANEFNSYLVINK